MTRPLVSEMSPVSVGYALALVSVLHLGLSILHVIQIASEYVRGCATMLVPIPRSHQPVL